MYHIGETVEHRVLRGLELLILRAEVDSQGTQVLTCREVQAGGSVRVTERDVTRIYAEV